MTLDEAVSNRVQYLRVIIGPEIVRLYDSPVQLLFAVLRGLFAAVAVENRKIRKQNIIIRLRLVAVVVARLSLALKSNLVAVLHVLSVSLHRVGCYSHVYDYILAAGWVLLLRHCR